MGATKLYVEPYIEEVTNAGGVANLIVGVAFPDV